MAPKADNPFTPGAGLAPPHRAGHERAQSHLAEELRRIHGGRTGGSTVLFGPPGHGKTALLGEAREDAHSARMRTVLLESGALVGDQSVLVQLMRGRKRTGIGKVWGLFGGVAEARKEVGGAHSWFDFEVQLHRALKRSPVLFMVDEAQELPPHHGTAFLQIMQGCFSRDLPLFLVMAGTPRLTSRFWEIGAGFAERSHHHRIGPLEPAEAVRDAFTVPMERAGIGIDDDALSLLVRESQSYSFYVQVLGKAAWKAAEGRFARGERRITLEDARAGVESAKAEILAFLSERHDEARRLGVLEIAVEVASELAAGGDGTGISERQLDGVLARKGIASGKDSWGVKKRLTDIGLIWRTTDRGWVQGIPSLGPYLADRGVDPGGGDAGEQEPQGHPSEGDAPSAGA